MTVIWLQKTLKGPVSLSGSGLHSGQQARMTLAPAPVNSGLVFRVVDPRQGHQDEVRIPALVEYVPQDGDLTRATTLTHAGVSIITVEHVLAALHGMGITNCEILLEGNEPPIGSCASAKDYVDMILEAGIREQGLPSLSYKVKRPVSWNRGDVQISAEPCENFRLSFHIDYDDPAIGIQSASFEICPEIFKDEIAPARTFAQMKDVAMLQQMGLERSHP